MDLFGDALRQAFMPKYEYESLREEDKAWTKLQRPVCMTIICIISVAIVISTIISLHILFPTDRSKRPFCNGLRLQPLSVNDTADGDFDMFHSAFYLTNKETVDYYFMVLFLPSLLLFLTSVVYLVSGFQYSAFLGCSLGLTFHQQLELWSGIRQVAAYPSYYDFWSNLDGLPIFKFFFVDNCAGITVASSASRRHGCLKLVENNYCTSRRGGAHCLAILNLLFAIIFGLLAVFLGSTLLSIGSSCSMPLFWCYEITTWGLVILYGGTAISLRRKAAGILNERELSGQSLGLEMLETNPVEIMPDMERRVNEGFRTWMGSSLLSSDEEDDDNDN